MALKTITVKIDESVYNITSLPTTKALAHFRTLLALSKDSIASLSKVIQEEEGSAEAIADLVTGLVMRMDDSKIENIIQNLIQESVAKGSTPLKGDDYELEFSGNFGVLIRLLVEVLKFNYGSLLKIGAIGVEVVGN